MTQTLLFPDIHATPAAPMPLLKFPKWYKPSKARRLGNARVLRGLHPADAGLPLGPTASTCGSCCFAVRRRLRSGKVFWKCDLVAWTHGPGTDVVKRWRGCHGWRPSVELTLRESVTIWLYGIRETLDLPMDASDEVAVDSALVSGEFEMAPLLSAWHWLRGTAEST